MAAVNAGAVFAVERRDTLTPGAWTVAGVTQQVLGDNGTVQVVRALVPASGVPRRFVRLALTPPP